MSDTLRKIADEFEEKARIEKDPILQQLYAELCRDYHRGNIQQICSEEIMEKKYEVNADSIRAIGDGARADGDIHIEQVVFVKQAASDAAGTNTAQLVKELQVLAGNLRENQGSDSTVISKVNGALDLAEKGEKERAVEEILEARDEIQPAVSTEKSPNLAQALRSAAPEIIDEERRCHIVPWRRLHPKEFLLEAETIGDIQIKASLRSIERYGIVQLRLAGQPSDEEILESYFKLIGVAAKWQNTSPGEIKTLRPTVEVDPNTGDSAQDLGFHVDGTQTVAQPALLAFQYVVGADVGGISRFVDLAGVLKGLREDERDAILLSLSEDDAATFDKKGMQFRGPIFHFPDGHSVAGRLRYDDVIDVKPGCKDAFDALGRAINDNYEITFRPRRGDIILFDNWRVMHARTEIYGDGQRVHRRVWMDALHPEHQEDYLLGIRPISVEVLAEMRRRNGLG